MFDHRVHHRPPTHPELACHGCDRAGLLADLTARFGTGTAGQHRGSVQLVDVLGPRLGRTQRLAAAPPAAEHLQPHGPTEARQITHRTRRAVLRLGTHTASRAPPDRLDRFDLDDQLVVTLEHLEHVHARQAQQHLHHRDTVRHARGSFRLQSSRNRNPDRTPGTERGPPHPHRYARSPIKGSWSAAQARRSELPIEWWTDFDPIPDRVVIRPISVLIR